MESAVLGIDQVNYAAQYLQLQQEIYAADSLSQSEDGQQEETKARNTKSSAEENIGKIEAELFVQTFLEAVYSEEIYEGKCKVWHLAEKVLGPNYNLIQLALSIWELIEAAIQKFLDEQKMPAEDRPKYIHDVITKAKKATRKGMVVFPYVRLKQPDQTSSVAQKLIELLKIEADQLVYSEEELNNVWVAKIQTRTQNKARNREELKKKKKRKADEISLSETDLTGSVDKTNVNTNSPAPKRQKKFSVDYSYPPTEIREDNDSFLIIAQVPGLVRESLNVKFIEGTKQVIIEGTCALPQEVAFQWPHENLFHNTRPFSKTVTLDRNIIPAHSGILNLDSCSGYIFIKCTFNDITEQAHAVSLLANETLLRPVVTDGEHGVLTHHEHIQMEQHYVTEVMTPVEEDKEMAPH